MSNPSFVSVMASKAAHTPASAVVLSNELLQKTSALKSDMVEVFYHSVEGDVCEKNIMEGFGMFDGRGVMPIDAWNFLRRS